MMRRGPRLALPFLLTVVVLSVAYAAPAAAGDEGNVTLVGPQRALVKGLPAPAQRALEAAAERQPPARRGPPVPVTMALADAGHPPAANAPRSAVGQAAPAGSAPTVLSN